MTPYDFLFSSVWIFAYILSPMMLLAGYNLLQRVPWVASPKLVFPVIGGFGVFMYFSYYPYLTAQGFVVQGSQFYDHFIFGAAICLLLYSLLGFKFGFTKLEALTLSILTTLAIDQLWQVPENVFNWTRSPQAAAVGLATGSFNLMSLPILFYFLYRFRGRVRISDYSLPWLFSGSLLTVMDCLVYPSSSFFARPYLLVLPWLGFFIFVYLS